MKKCNTFNEFLKSMFKGSCISAFSLILTLFFVQSLNAQNGTAINTTGALPNPSAIFDVSSTSQGMMIPRMTTAQRGSVTVNASTVGLMIYNTDCNALNYYNGSAWITIGNEGSVPTPGAITGTTAYCNSYTSAVFSVTPVTGATGYNWIIPTGATLNSGQGTSSVTITGTVSGNLCVTAFNACGASMSSCAAISVSTAAPTVPTANAATNIGTSSFTANWSASSNSPVYYLLDVSTSNTFSTFFGSYNNLNIGNVTSTIISGISSGSTYYYRIRAFNGCGTTANSGTTTVSIPGVSGAYTWAPKSEPITSNYSNVAYAICQDGTYSYVAGVDYGALYNYSRWRIEKRYLSDGTLVNGFGTGGVIEGISSSNGTGCRPYGITCDANYVYVVGVDLANNPSAPYWRMEVYSVGNGTQNSTLTNDYGSQSSYNSAYAVAVYGGYIYIAGEYNSKWAVLKLNMSGQTVTAWNSSGYWYGPSSSYPNTGPSSMVIDGTNIYLAGCDNPSGTNRWLVAATPVAGCSSYSQSCGPWSGNFGASYWVLSGLAYNTQALSITGDGNAGSYTNIYIGGYDNSNGTSSPEWRIEKRTAIDGKTVNTFGTSGTQVESSIVGQINGIAADANGLYCVGYDNTGGGEIRIESRKLTDGTLNTSFNTTGIFTDNTSSGMDQAYGVSISSTNIYIVGEDANSNIWEWRIESLWR